MKLLGPGAVVLLIALGAYLRLSDLGAPPLQFDEGVNWYLASSANASGRIPYDAEHFHGPLFFRILAQTGLDSEAALRMPSAFAGLLALVTSVLLARRQVGWVGAAAVSALLAFDPITAFYSRLAIHESLFALLTLLFTLTLWCYGRHPRWPSGVAAGALLGLLAATKETCVVPLAATFAALMVTFRPQPKALALGLGCLMFGATLGISVGFGSVTGASEFARGLWAWMEKGISDRTQFQPWWFYPQQLFLSSPLALLGILGLFSDNQCTKYLALQGLGSLVLYSLLPYKTPWLLVSIVPVLLISLGLQAQRVVPALLCSMATVLVYCTPASTAYVRLNDSTPEVRNLAQDLRTQCGPIGPTCSVFVGAKWYWPLPFYLRDLNARITYADGPKPIPIETFDVIILPPQARALHGWTRREYTLSRVQSVSAFWR